MKNLLPSLVPAATGLLLFAGSVGPVAAQAIPSCSGTDPGGNAATRGLYAEYYSGYYSDNQSYFSDGSNPAKLTRVDSAANFQTNASFGNLVGLGVTTAGTAANPDQFSVRYRGSFYAPTSTTYTFYLNSDDASAMWIDNDALTSPPLIGAALINNSGAHSATVKQASVYLSAGFHNVLLHYGEAGGDNVMTLRFSTSTISQRYVPSKLFCTSVQPVGGPQALAYSPMQATVLSGAAGTSPAPTVTRRSGDAAPAYYELLNAPSGISINPTTGVLSVAPGTAIGNYTLSLRATTTAGNVYSNAFTFSVVANPNANCSGFDEGGSAASNGLYAKYFAGYFNDVQSFFTTNREGVSRIDPQLNYTTNNWGTLTPPATGSDANPDVYSARYRGSLLIATAGTYTLSLTSDDASFLWLDNYARRTTQVSTEALINNGGVHASKTVTATQTLTAGKHDLLIHFGENAGNNILLLEYSGPDTGGSTVAVPASALCSSSTGLPLPVELTRFEAQPAAEGVSLHWNTAQELRSAYFAVERSASGDNFQEVGRLAGAGTTSIPQVYKTIDRAPLAGLAYYRLRSVDTDGTAAYSSIVAVTTSKPTAFAGLTAQVVPNPAQLAGPLSLRVQQPVALPVQLSISDLSGRTLYQRELPAAAATTVDLALPALRTSGVYLLRLTSAAGTATQKLVLQ